MRMQNRAGIAAAVALAAAAVLTAHEPARAKMAKGTKTLWAPGEVRWSPMAGLPGARQAALWGDPAKGEHGILYRWPAATDVPVHWHTNGDHGVVISGTMSLAVDGAPAKDLPAGSYFSLSGGMRHTTSCKSGTDCVFFVHREGLFDVQGLPEAAATPPKK